MGTDGLCARRETDSERLTRPARDFPRVLMTCWPRAGRRTWPLGRLRRPHSARPEGRLIGAGPQERSSADCRGGQSHVRLPGRKSSDAITSAGVVTRVIMSGYSGPHGTGRTRRIPEEPEIGMTEPIWPARSPLPILEPRQARQALESNGRTPPVRGSSGRRDSEATSNQKTSQVTETEVTRAWSDLQEQDSDGPLTSGSIASLVRPGITSVARLFNSFQVFLRQSEVHPRGTTIPSFEVTAPRP
jgi:hypothetical protein